MCKPGLVCESGRAEAENKANDSVIHYICNLLFVQEKKRRWRDIFGFIIKQKERKKRKPKGGRHLYKPKTHSEGIIIIIKIQNKTKE